MERIFNHTQLRRTDKGRSYEKCNVDIYYYNDTILFECEYTFTYQRPNDDDQEVFMLSREVETVRRLNLNLKTSNFTVYNHTHTKGFFGDLKSAKPKTTKNRFDLLAELTSFGFYKGGKEKGWGVRFDKKIEEAWVLMKDIIQPRIENDYLKTKGYNKVEVNPMFDLIVDYHLDCNDIKGHDLIYLDIQNDYPKLKFLKQNDRKFIPSVLDGYGIKTKHYVSTLTNNDEGMPIIIKSLNYFSKLYGENYIDYMNKVDWHLHCYKIPPTNRTHELKNEREKKNMLKTMVNWERDGLSRDSLIHSLYSLLELRDKLEKTGIDLKYTATNDEEFRRLEESWKGLKQYLSRGYKIRYTFPDEFLGYIEEEIIIGDVKYTPKVLSTEEDFKVEGHIMKNCMGGQFNHGSIFIFISLRKGKRWVDVRFNKGEQTMVYGKANSPVPDDFKVVVAALSKRVKKYGKVSWVKEKYDLIK
jgi:hypothetical protein